MANINSKLINLAIFLPQWYLTTNRNVFLMYRKWSLHEHGNRYTKMTYELNYFFWREMRSSNNGFWTPNSFFTSTCQGQNTCVMHTCRTNAWLPKHGKNTATTQNTNATTTQHATDTSAHATHIHTCTYTHTRARARSTH